MDKESIALLGIPIDNLTMDETIDYIFDMVSGYEKDNTPRYVATVNVDFIVNTLSWKPDRSRHPELLDILRRADLITADGMPLVWASRIMDAPIKERVAGSDMAPRLAEKAAKLGKSIFLFGGGPGQADRASGILRSHYPGLKIAGTYSPVVSTEGEAMLDSAEQDKEILNKINKSGADILLIGLGNPKQEIWFKRIKNKLNVPVSIGVGGSFSFITGDVARAPLWMQKNGLEWIYRIAQDPARLWKRYFKGFFKLGTCILSPIIINKISIALEKSRKQTLNFTGDIEITESSKKKSAILKMPGRVTRESIEKAESRLLSHNSSSIIFDFKNTVYMDLYALGFLINTWKHCMSCNKPLFITGVNSLMRRFLKYNRIWDILGKLHYDNPEMLINKNNTYNYENSFHYTTDSSKDRFKIDLHGRLDAANISKLDIPGLIKLIGDRNCIINLKNLKFVDSTGLIFFLKIKKHLSAHNKTPIMCNANEDVLQIFNITKLLDLFRVAPDLSNEKSLIKEAV